MTSTPTRLTIDNPTVAQIDDFGWLQPAVDAGRVTFEYAAAILERADRWVPANGGFESPSRAWDGTDHLYVFNPATGEHGWLNLSTDIVSADCPY